MPKETKIIGKSSTVKKLMQFITLVANTDSNILLLGETGVGKELAARMIHSCGERRTKPFIKVNCANINENLLESELFGYKKGAFTSAWLDKSGLIEEAQGGTFLLDEIADITHYLQAKLLAIIEDKELRRLGEKKTRKIDVRFIFSTNKDLYKLVTKGNFRQDLYFRINLLTFSIQPLRERKEDIPLLTQSILNKENIKKNKNKRITQEALHKLQLYDYPGNIRELKNIIKRAFIFSNDNDINPRDIELEIVNKKNNLNSTEELFRKIKYEKKSFWEVIHKPFLRRELNRKEVKEIIAIGLEQTKGSYKNLLPLFNINQKDYKKFMDIIRIHKLRM